MRQEQFDRLQDLSERLTDVFIDEADPEGWPGKGLQPGVMDQQMRGDRYWCKKNAVATLSLVSRIVNLSGAIRIQGGLGGDPVTGGDTPDSLLDNEISAAEREATKLLDQVQRAAKKREFDNHVHGKQKS